LADALYAETVFWHMLDACRIRLYERALRPYVNAVRKTLAGKTASFQESHDIRLHCAIEHLEISPMAIHGLPKLLSEAIEATERRVNPSLMKWLPNGLNHFIGLV
jgi:hypothetical protein